METKFTCDRCHKEIIHTSNISIGYGVTKTGEKHCYTCCGEVDLNDLKNLPFGERFVGYLIEQDEKWWFTNWPESMNIRVHGVKKSNHNFCGKNGRIDFWFQITNELKYHGVQIGKDTLISIVWRVKK